ncbi:MAG: hypothetical protein RBS39_01685 [Phycisphaerales bacterium]|jgi:hypothetical protein|nr:hypothetical protein [Phycisphaerales bacterium]
MSGRDRPRRPFTRRAPGSALSSRAGRLASSSGRATVEPLENRQLLFSLNITGFDGDTVQAFFAYTIPTLFPVGIDFDQAQDPEVRLEEFSELPGGGNGVQNLVSGAVFQNSGLRVQHNIPLLTNVQADARDTTGFMIVRLQNSERIDYSMFSQYDPMVPANQQTLGSFTNAQFTITAVPGSSQGLDATNMAVDLLRRDASGETVIDTLTGAELLAANQTGAAGVGTFSFNAPQGQSFNIVRIRALGLRISDGFRLDNFQTTFVPPTYAEAVDQRVFGVRVDFRGPVGSSVQFLDLYGREIIQTLALGIPQDGEIPLVDLDGDGVPNFNDGIGQIIITGGDANTYLQIWGGIVEDADANDAQNIFDLGGFLQGGFGFTPADAVLGLYDAFEEAGFGYAALAPDNEVEVWGLPPGPGSVIIGAPQALVRNNSSQNAYNPQGLPIVGNQAQSFLTRDTTNFSPANQGIFVRDGSNIGSISVHGVVHGSSRFNGAVGRLGIGYLVGSVTVEGDLGDLYVGSDAGQWVLEPDATPGANDDDDFGDFRFKTDSKITVGRTLRSYQAAGRSNADLTVIGDVSNTAARPGINPTRYQEAESILPVDTTVDVPNTIAVYLSDVSDIGADPRSQDVPFVFGDTYLRNNTILGAEWVGGNSSVVRISGDVGFFNSIANAEDLVDVYGFAADGRREVVVEWTGVVDARIVDERGRVVASYNYARFLDGRGANPQIRFTPDAPGSYYLVVAGLGQGDGDEGSGTVYDISLSGITPSTLGSYRTGAGSDGANLTNTLNVLSGDVGAIRIGTGFVGGAGGDVDPMTVFNTRETDVDNYISWQQGIVNIAGSLMAIVTGGDIADTNRGGGQVSVFVGGDFGRLTTGLLGVVGVGPEEGDVGQLTLSVGGSIGMIDVSGMIGNDQDSETSPIVFNGVFVVRTGRGGGSGDIGMFRVGSHISGNTLVIETSANSTIGAFLVSQDVPDGPLDGNIEGIWYGNLNPIDFRLGVGSDVRFVDFPRIDLNVVDAFLPIIGGQTLEVVDDSGARVQISVPGAPVGFTIGRVRILPINGSEGVAIGEIEVDLSGGQGLVITGVGDGSDRASIGRIELTGSAAASSITINGSIEVDVWQITQATVEGAGTNAAFQSITNSTPGGDIVAIDVLGLQDLIITGGNLGSTQTPTFGPKNIGPFLGIVGTAQAAVGAPIGLTAALTSDGGGDWNGGLYRPVGDASGGGAGALSDIGSPIDPYLNGAIVRTGSINSVVVSGSVGDVILQGTGAISRVTANSDGVRQTSFDGIVGNIYASTIARVDLGDGLAASAQNALQTTSIVADNDIWEISGQAGSVIRGVINAADSGVGPDPNFERRGVETIALAGGRIEGAYIGGMNHDDFWTSFANSDNGNFLGNVRTISVTDGDIFASTLRARDIQNVTILNGFFDASAIDAGGQIDLVQASGFRNSTQDGSNFEYRPATIVAGLNLGTLRTIGDGEIRDLSVNVTGSVTGSITTTNIIRSSIGVNNTLTRLDVASGIRGSTVIAGRLINTNAEEVVTSEFRIAGPIDAFLVDGQIRNTSIEVSGPDGRIERLEAGEIAAASITSTGRIGTITTTEGDLDARIVTTTSRGTVDLLDAERDLVIETDIAATVNRLVAGRHIGRAADPSVILVRGGLQSVDAEGTLYSGLRVGQSITGDVSLGRVFAKPGNDNVGSGSIIAFGRINSVTVEGDFGGQILSYSSGIGTITINNGSLRPDASISAFDGDIARITINAGHLLGDIYTDRILYSLTVNPSADGVFGDIGVNPALASAIPFDSVRNQLPPGVAATSAIDGPRIVAGQNIGNITVSGGGMFEAFIHAGWAIGSINVRAGEAIAGDITTPGYITQDSATPGLATTIAAGDSIFAINVGRNLRGARILAGVTSFGADGLAGGTGVNADSVKPGTVETINVGGSAISLVISAGVTPGANGIYQDADDRVTLGRSSVNTLNVGGTLSGVSVFSDEVGAAIAGNSQIFKPAAGVLQPANPLLAADNDGGLSITSGTTFSWNDAQVTASFSGPGAAFWDAANGRVILRNTTLDSSLSVSSDTRRLTDFDIVTNDQGEMGSIVIASGLYGDSDIVIDGRIAFLRTGLVDMTGSWEFGGNANEIVTGSFTRGHIFGQFISVIYVGTDFGVASEIGEATISALTPGSIRVVGTNSGDINADRRIARHRTDGQMYRATLRSGGTVELVRAGSMSQTWVSVSDRLDAVTVEGDVFDSSIMAGGDLGRDGRFGGTGANADRATTGTIGNVTISGNFVQSDIVSGILRGQDGFFGTSDDLVAEGRGGIGSVRIMGEVIGTNLGSEAYQIASTGTSGAITTGSRSQQLNTRIGDVDFDPLALQVLDVAVTEAGRIYTATITFNQAVNSATIEDGILVRELRAGGQTVLLDANSDYVVEYDAANNAARIIFFQSVTSRDLPQVAGVAGPGTYQFEVDQDIIRAQVVNARLDGDNDGFVEPGEDFFGRAVVGDAGDKLTAGTTPVIVNGEEVLSVDFYGPTSLDTVLDDPRQPDGLPETNRVITIRGSIGDHPDNDPDYFTFASEVDIYSITLQAGQILKFSDFTGASSGTDVLVRTPSGQIVSVGFGGDTLVGLPVQPDLSFETFLAAEGNLLATQTGTYQLILGTLSNANNQNGNDITDTGVVPRIDQLPGIVGSYSFNLEIFDDGDSGFNAPSDAGDGADIIDAPTISEFAGPDGQFGTADDRAMIVNSGYTFTISAGADGTLGTSDDVVSGSNGQGITSSRVGSRLTSVIDSAIGPAGNAGNPTQVTPDVDVFHLSGGRSVAPGTLITITVKLNELGANLGGRIDATTLVDDATSDFSNNVRFAVFDTFGSTGVGDARLVFSPSDFTPFGGEEGVIAQNGANQYGFDENGDFYITFAAPGRINGSGQRVATPLAIYLQGVFNTDYRLEVVTQGVSSATTRSQNVFIETRGGTIDWLLATNPEFQIEGFSAEVVGFRGRVNGTVTVDNYIVTRLLQNLQGIFDAAGFDVNFSSNSSDFEFQNFSTVFLSSSVDPSTSTLFINETNGIDGPFGVQSSSIFSVSERVDALNTDANDEAIVFIPGTASLGYTQSLTAIDAFTDSITGIVAARVGELLGLRSTVSDNSFNGGFDFMGGNAAGPFASGGTPFSVQTVDRNLTDGFFIGRQNADSLLDRILAAN